jgi:DNA-binding IclR family transcriptional regulator
MTVYNQGKQIVVANIDAQLDVLLSASGRVLLAFQDEETRQARIQE